MTDEKKSLKCIDIILGLHQIDARLFIIISPFVRNMYVLYTMKLKRNSNRKYY